MSAGADLYEPSSEKLRKIIGGAYCFVEPTEAGETMRAMAIELLASRAEIERQRKVIEAAKEMRAELRCRRTDHYAGEDDKTSRRPCDACETARAFDAAMAEMGEK